MKRFDKLFPAVDTLESLVKSTYIFLRIISLNAYNVRLAKETNYTEILLPEYFKILHICDGVMYVFLYQCI